MKVIIHVKIVGVDDTGEPGEPGLEDVVEFIKTLQNLEGVTVEVE